jgi:cold shock CspA family protein
VSRAAPRGVVKDLFVHHTGINANGFKSLAEGAKVSFDAKAATRGRRQST